MVKRLLLLVSSVILAVLCRGADTIPPLPPGRLLERAADPSQWSIDVALNPQDSTTPPTDPAQIPHVKVTVVKSNQIFFTEITNGPTQQIWSIGNTNVMLAQKGASPLISVGAPSNGFTIPDYAKTDFAGFDWIKPANYTGVASVQGRSCLVFKDEVNFGLCWGVISHGEALAKIAGEADIDVATRMPVRLSLGNEVRTYVFSASAPAPLSVPADVTKAIDKMSAQIKSSARMPARP